MGKRDLSEAMHYTALLTLELLEAGEMSLADKFSGVCLEVQKVLDKSSGT